MQPRFYEVTFGINGTSSGGTLAFMNNTVKHFPMFHLRDLLTLTAIDLEPVARNIDSFVCLERGSGERDLGT